MIVITLGDIIIYPLTVLAISIEIYMILYMPSPNLVFISPVEIYMGILSLLSIISLVAYAIRRNINFAGALNALIQITGAMVFLILMFALVFKGCGIRSNGIRTDHAIDLVYLSVITWTTTGYGDIVPFESCRLTAALEAFTGYIYMGLYLAVILQAISLTQTSAPD